MIWVVGSDGMLGKEICSLLRKEQISFQGTDKEVNITSLAQLNEASKKIKPTWIINCAAYTNVDGAEDNKAIAYQLNSDGPCNLAKIASKLDIPLIHISTDYVFSTVDKQIPIKEDFETNPISVYGDSKLSGELAIQKYCKKYFIFRTSWLYGKHGKNFVFTMLKLMQSKSELKVVSDQLGSPTWTFDLAEHILFIIKNKRKEYGLYHFSNQGSCSWYGFAKEINKIAHQYNYVSYVNVIPCNTDQYPTKAKRPKYSVLSKNKILKTFYLTIPKWHESLQNFLEEIDISDIK